MEDGFTVTEDRAGTRLGWKSKPVIPSVSQESCKASKDSSGTFFFFFLNSSKVILKVYKVNLSQIKVRKEVHDTSA